jgi:uncharacterized membrane protein YesL
MFGFLIKKSFFDLWDNFLPAILLNLGFIVVLVIPIVLPPTVSALGASASVALFFIGVITTFIYIGGASGMAREVVNYQSLEWSSFFRPLRENLIVSAILGALVILHILLLSVAVPIYSTMGNYLGLFALAILFWMSVIWWLSIQYVIPVRCRLASHPVSVFKKAFILMLDNAFFSILLGLGALVIILLSFFTAFLIPGIAGVVIWYQAALKLRLYKYDFLESNPEASARAIPWDDLLYDDRERVGKRTLRGMIFPWKE